MCSIKAFMACEFKTEARGRVEDVREARDDY